MVESKELIADSQEYQVNHLMIYLMPHMKMYVQGDILSWSILEQNIQNL